MKSRKQSRGGFTLVELLVVIAIIGILVALLLPAVQAAREAARRSQCQNHLKQLATGCLLHHDTYKFLPSAGWGYYWTGDPDAGAGASQPGSWTFSILPFIEEQALYDLGADRAIYPYDSATQKAGATEREQTPIAFMHCPSRRAAILYQRNSARFPFRGLNFNSIDRMARIDYAGNMGNTPVSSTVTQYFPKTVAEADTYLWRRQTDGVLIQRGELPIHRIEDGTSSTYLICEKFLDVLAYEDGSLHNDSESLHTGFNNDSLRGTCAAPLQDTPGVGEFDVFGSVHPGAWLASYCDGSVQAMSYDIEPVIHAQNGGRNGKDCNLSATSGL